MNFIDVMCFKAEVTGINPNLKSELLELLTSTLWWGHCLHDDGYALLKLLKQPHHKIIINQINRNCFGAINNFFPSHSKIPSNGTYQESMHSILNIKGKGYGGGELFLEIFSDTGEGETAVSEIKNLTTFASIKVCNVNETAQTISDIQNKNFWDGNTPGTKKNHNNVMNILQQQVNPKKYLEDYFSKIYPNDYQTIINDVLFSNLITTLDPHDWSQCLGKILLKIVFIKFSYERLIFFNPNTKELIVLCDPTDETFVDTYLVLKPMLKRGRDTQAVADGFLNVKARKSN